MKKGIQYTHYVAGDIMEIINAAWLAKDTMDGSYITSIEYIDYVMKRAEKIAEKIAELDKINDMKY